MLCLVFKGLYGHIAYIKANMPKKAKKHTILGGIKVSSQQLSEWGNLGGRPKKWENEAERKRAERLRKKQEKFGKEVELREYRSYEEKPTISFTRMICDNCQAKSIGGSQHLGNQCSRCFKGKTVEEKVEIRKRAGSSQERNKRFRERMVENKKKKTNQISKKHTTKQINNIKL